jgi:NAD+ diphosphatase
MRSKNILDAFKYCPRCASPFNKTRRYLNCEACGLHYYPNPKPCTAIVIINAENEFLLVERGGEPKKGWWDLPGGFVDMHENFEESARRELQEELHISVGSLEYIGSVHDVYEFQDVAYTTACAVFMCEISSDIVMRPDDDVAAYQFFLEQDLPRDKIAFVSLVDALDLAISKNQN